MDRVRQLRDQPGFKSGSSLWRTWASVPGQAELPKHACQHCRLWYDSQTHFRSEPPHAVSCTAWRLRSGVFCVLPPGYVHSRVPPLYRRRVCNCMQGPVCVHASFKHTANGKFMLSSYTLIHSSSPASVISSWSPGSQPRATTKGSTLCHDSPNLPWEMRNIPKPSLLFWEAGRFINPLTILELCLHFRSH